MQARVAVKLATCTILMSAKVRCSSYKGIRWIAILLQILGLDMCHEVCPFKPALNTGCLQILRPKALLIPFSGISPLQ